MGGRRARALGGFLSRSRGCTLFLGSLDSGRYRCNVHIKACPTGVGEITTAKGASLCGILP